MIDKLCELSLVITEKSATIDIIQQSYSEIQKIVNHIDILNTRANEILINTTDVLEKKISEVESAEVEEYSTAWLNFMYNKSDINTDHINKIKLTKNTSVNETSFIKSIDNEIVLKLPGIEIKTTVNSIENLPLNYSPDIIRYKNKSKRHIGPLISLDSDIERLKNHPALLEEEKNRIQTSLIYNMCLLLALSN